MLKQERFACAPFFATPATCFRMLRLMLLCYTSPMGMQTLGFCKWLALASDFRCCCAEHCLHVAAAAAERDIQPL